MKNFFILFVSLFMIFSLPFCPTASDINYTANDIIPIEALTESKADFLNSLDLKLLSTCEEKGGICSFDINDKGNIVVAQRNPIINIYDFSGNYLYGYSFSNSTQSSYGVKWNGDNVVICISRGSVAIEVDRNGNCINIIDNQYFKNDIYAKDREYKEYSFKMTNDSPLDSYATDYAKLIKINPDGSTMVLYDASSNRLIRIIILIIIIGGVFTVVSILIIKNILKQKKINL